MRSFFLCALSLFLITACARQWVRAGATQQEFSKDFYECRLQSAYIPDLPPSNLYLTPANPYDSPAGAFLKGYTDGRAYGKALQRPSAGEILRLCMEARGYSRGER